MKINDNDLNSIDSVTSYNLPASAITEQLGILHNSLIVNRVNNAIRKIQEFVKAHNDLVDFVHEGKKELNSIEFRLKNLETKIGELLQQDVSVLEERIVALEEEGKKEEVVVPKEPEYTGWNSSMGDIV